MSAAQVFARWRNTLPGERLSRAWRSNPLRPYAEPSLPHEAVRVYVDWRGGQFRDRGLVPFPRPPGTPRTRSGHRVLMYRPSPVVRFAPGPVEFVGAEHPSDPRPADSLAAIRRRVAARR
jgi:hypothetical protein